MMHTKPVTIPWKIFALFCAALFLAPNYAIAQSHTVKIDEKVKDHLGEVDDLLAHKLDDIKGQRGFKMLIAGYALNDSLKQFQNMASGAVIKNGAVRSISTVLDDKSLTINYTIPFKKLEWIAFQPTVTGSSSKGVVSLFNGAKYANTLSVGVNITATLCGRPNFNKADRIPFKLALSDSLELFNATRKKFIDEKNELIGKVEQFIARKQGDLFMNGIQDNANYQDYFKAEREVQSLLKNLKDFYPEDFDVTDKNEVKIFIKELIQYKKVLVSHLFDAKKLAYLDTIQANAPFTSYSYHYLTFKPKFNTKDYPIYDPAKADELFTRTSHDNYWSFGLSYNYLKANKKTRFFIYPTITFDNSRKYKSSDSLSLSIQHPFITGIDSIQSIQSTGFFRNEAQRKLAINLELPVMYYWTKAKIGIDAAAGVKFQPSYTSFAARIGVFFALPGKDGQNITLEPLFRYEDNKEKTYAKNFDKFSFGFNLSFSIPSIVTTTKQ